MTTKVVGWSAGCLCLCVDVGNLFSFPTCGKNEKSDDAQSKDVVSQSVAKREVGDDDVHFASRNASTNTVRRTKPN